MTGRALLSHAWQHATTIIFLAGFLIDSFLLPSVDEPITKYLGLTYLVVLTFLFPIREWVVSRNTASDWERKLFSLLTFGISFFSGSALSFIFVYAMRSAALAVSWPLFLILILCMFANEFVSTHNYRFTLDIAVYYIALVFYAIFNVPIAFGQVNDFVFLVAIVLSIAIGFLFMTLLRRTSETAEFESARGFALAVGIPMFVGMLYILNVIPAVPLSLRDDGVYHNITRTDSGEYLALKEKDDRFFAKYRRPVYHLTDTDSGVYFFSSVGAPAELSAPITHVWEYYDETTKKWVTSTTISFDLSGGREGGYRAYSKKENLQPGMWRVTVKVDDNRIVGRKRFYIQTTGSAQVEEVKL
ncbi:MAG: DUF2914 domain-containing protein [Candidatus Paceibacterota bacterium]